MLEALLASYIFYILQVYRIMDILTLRFISHRHFTFRKNFATEGVHDLER